MLLTELMIPILFTAPKEKISWYAFGTQTNEHTLPMLDYEHRYPTSYLVEIISPVTSIEQRDTEVIVPEPILICIFDKNRKKIKE